MKRPAIPTLSLAAAMLLPAYGQVPLETNTRFNTADCQAEGRIPFAALNASPPFWQPVCSSDLSWNDTTKVLSLDFDDLDLTTLSDPGADRITFWDDGAGVFTHLVANTCLTITGTDLDFDVTCLSGGSAIWTRSGTDIFPTNIGDGLGLGTSSVDELLHLESASSGKPVLKIENTNADAGPPILEFSKNSASPADGDDLGTIRFMGDNDLGAETDFAYIQAESSDVTSTSLDSRLVFRIRTASTLHAALRLNRTEAIINQDSQDYDFRVESDGDTHAFFVRGSDGNVGFGTSTPDTEAHLIGGMTIESADTGTDPGPGNLYVESNVGIGTAAPGFVLDINNDTTANLLQLESDNGVVLRFNDTDTAQEDWSIVAGANDLAIRRASDASDRLRFEANGDLIFDFSGDGGNIGIADATPDALLDFDLISTSTAAASEIGGSFTVTDTGIVAIGTDTTTGLDLNLTRTGALGGTINSIALDIDATADTGGTSALTGLDVNVGGADTNYAAIFQGGNVGIGTTDPLSNLEVRSNGSDVELLIHEEAGSAESRLRLRRAALDFELVLGTGGSADLRLEREGAVIARWDTRYYTNTIRDHSGGNLALQDDAGNVGIGTASPSSKLEVSGSFELSGSFFDAAGANFFNAAVGAGSFLTGINADGSYSSSSNSSSATALAANPNDCSTSEWAQSIVASGDLGCTSSLVDNIANVHGITLDNNSTSTAADTTIIMAAGPTDFTLGIEASGNDFEICPASAVGGTGCFEGDTDGRWKFNQNDTNTATPTLELNQDGTGDPIFRLSVAATDWNVFLDNSSGDRLAIETGVHSWRFLTNGETEIPGDLNGSDTFNINAQGITPQIQLQISGTNRFSVTSTVANCSACATTGTGTALIIDGSNNIETDSSSRRYKKNIRPMEEDSALIFDLKPPKSFERNNDGAYDFNLIAEEVALVIPALASYDNLGRPEGVRNSRLAVLMLVELGKLREKVHELENQVDLLTARIR